MEAALLLIVAGAGYMLSKRRNEPGRVPLAVSPMTSYTIKKRPGTFRKSSSSSMPISVDASDAEARDRPSVHDPYHCTRVQDVYAHEKELLMQNTFSSSMTGDRMPATHGNMVPFFRGSEPPGSATNRGHEMENFVGEKGSQDFTSLSGGKREIQQLFRPTEARVDVLRPPVGIGGSEYRDVVQLPRNRANELPFEQVRVQPIPEEKMREMGGLRALTVDDMRSLTRPKQSLPGQIIPGSSTSTATDRPKHQPINTQTRPPPLIREQKTTDDFMRTGGAAGSQPGYDKIRIVDRHTERETMRSADLYKGAAAPVGVHRMEDRGGSQRNLIFRTPLGEMSRGPATTTVKSVTDYGRSGMSVPGNARMETGSRTRPGTLTTAVKALVAPLQDVLRTTRKEEYLDSAPVVNLVGSHGVSKLTVYDSQDVARTTLKDVLLDSAPVVNLVGSHGVPKLTVYDSQDVTRTTRKEVGIHDGHQTGNFAGGSVSRRGPVVDPDSGARHTLREATAVNPDGHQRNLYAKNVGGVVYSADDAAPDATRKDVALGQDRGGGLPTMTSGRGAYSVSVLDPPRSTMRETVADSGTRFGVSRLAESSGAYVVAKPDSLEATMRSTTTDGSEYYGTSESAVTGPVSRADVGSVEPALSREALVMTGREFLVDRRGGCDAPAGARFGAGVAEMGVVGDERGGDPALRDGGWQSSYLNSSVAGGGDILLPYNTVEPDPEPRYTVDRLMGDIEGRRAQQDHQQ